MRPLPAAQITPLLGGLGLLVILTGCQRPPSQNTPSPSLTVTTSSPTAASAVTAPVPANVTYNEHVAPILFDNCATCHRPIEAAPVPPATSASAAAPALASDPLCVAGAPFSVLDYRYVQPRAKAIASAVTRRAMPPWLPEAGHGEFLNERRLSETQIAIIRAWADGGAPEGDPVRRPPVPVFPVGWQLGTPDLVLTAEEPYTLPARGGDAFRNFVLRVPPAATRYVRAIEFRADNPRVLHHANVGLDPRRVSRLLDRKDAGPGFASMPEDQVQDVFGWSPGKVPVMEPADTAWTLEEGSDLVVQLHMVPSGAPEVVRPSVGLFFATTPPTRVPITVKLESKTIDIPADDAAYVVEDSYVLPADVEAVSVYPHAHYLAKEMRGTATLPDGTVTPLLWIRNWSVRWQDQYRYRAPVFLPQGTTLRMRFTYDNSAANPNNKFRPPRRIQWGPLSTDEMGALWLEVVPRRAEDAALLTRDYFARALRADIASAEMRAARTSRNAADLNALATKYIQAGRVGDAVTQLERALAADPSDAEAHSNLGTALQAQGRLPEAMRHLGDAARLKPADDRIRFNLGNGYYASGQLDDAAREFRRAIELNADNEDAHFNLAMIVGPRNQLDEAVGHLRRVIELNPQNADAQRNLGLALSLQGKLDEAIVRVNASLRIRPGAADATQLLGQLLQAKAARDGRR